MLELTKEKKDMLKSRVFYVTRKKLRGKVKSVPLKLLNLQTPKNFSRKKKNVFVQVPT